MGHQNFVRLAQVGNKGYNLMGNGACPKLATKLLLLRCYNKCRKNRIGTNTRSHKRQQNEGRIEMGTKQITVRSVLKSN